MPIEVSMCALCGGQVWRVKGMSTYLHEDRDEDTRCLFGFVASLQAAVP